MKTSYEKRVTTVVIVLFLAVGCIASVFGIVSQLFNKTNSASQSADIDYKELYPFDESSSENTAEETYSKTELLPVRIMSFVKEKISNFFQYKFFLSNSLCGLYGKINDSIGKNMIYNDEFNVYRLENGWLSYPKANSDGVDFENSISEFKEYLDEIDTDFLCVMEAHSGDERAGQVPEYFSEFFNAGKSTENVIDLFEKDNICYIDSYSVLAEQSEDYYSFFFKTDHHWNNLAGFTVAGAIAEEANAQFGMNIDTEIFNIDNYSSVCINEDFIGSLAKKTTHGFVSELDDLEALIPNFETDLQIEIPSWSLSLRGEYFDTLLEQSQGSEQSDYLNAPYTKFMHGDASLINVENFLCDNEYRVLVIKDSKANVVTPHLATAVRYLDIIDPRAFDGSIKTFIKETKPDLVIVIADYDSEYSFE